MSIWSIYRNSGQAPNMIAVCDSLEYHGEWMGDCFLTVSVKSPTPVTFRVGDYVEYRGEKYYIDYDPNTIKKAESGTYKEGFTYDGIKLYSEFHALSDIMMKDYVLNDNGLAYSQQANFSFFASSVEDLADRIQANLDKATKGQNWKVVTPNPGRSEYRNGGTDITASERIKYYGAYPDGGYRDVNVVCNSIMLTDAVKMAYDLFGLSFIVTDRRIIIGGTPQPVSSSLSYGKGYGLYEVEKVTDESQRVVTKMYAYGSSDNLPLNYYANLHKQYKAIVSKVDKKNPQYYYCEFTLSMSYKASMFTEVCKWTDSSGNTYNNMGYVVKIKLGSTEITARVNNPKDSTDGLVHIYAEYVAGSEDPSDEPNQAKMSAFITSLTAGQTIYFTAGIDKNRWPTSGIDYGDSANYPALLSISNLMLPGFPDQSLYEWVASHGGTDLNESSGQATYNGHTAYFSKEKMSPWIMSVNADTLGEREGAVYFDGSSNDTENIHPTIESTGGNVVTYGSSITDNGYLADNTDLSFSIEITAAGDLDWRELYNSRQEDAYLNMKSGYCTGRAFKMLSLPKKTGSSWTMKLERSKDGSLDRYFPYQDMSATYSKYAQIRANDTFVATGIQLPKAYVDAASEKLLEAALERLEAIDHPKQTYIPKIDELWAARDYDKKHTTSSDTSLYTNIYPGMNFSFEDADVLGAGVTMTRVIDSLTIKEDGNNGIPKFDVVLREEKEETFEQRVQSQMSSGSSGSGKSSSGQGITEDDIDSYVDGMMKVDMFSKLFEVHGKIKNGELDVNGTDTKIGYKDWKKVFDDDDAKWKKWEQAHAQDKKPYESLLNIKAKRGLWSEFFISALGVGGSGTGTPFELNEPLNSINNMKSLPTTVGHTIVWNGSGWGFGKAGGGDELGDVLQDIKEKSVGTEVSDLQRGMTLEYDGTNWKYGYLLRGFKISITTDGNIKTFPFEIPSTASTPTLDFSDIFKSYITVGEANNLFVTKAFFEKLFQVHEGSDTVGGTVIETNGDLTNKTFNIESLVGFWTKKWVSALGANGSGSGGGTAFDLSPILADINMSQTQPVAGALYYNGSAGSWSFVQLNQGIDETALQNYLDNKKYIKAAADTKWWGQAMSNGIVKGDITDVGSITPDATNAKAIGSVDKEFSNADVRVVWARHIEGSRAFKKNESGNENLYLQYATKANTYINTRGGYVGIGTESPYTLLDVNGSAKATRLYLRKPNAGDDTGAIYLEFDGNSNTPGVHLVGAGLWSDSYISALGSNPTQGTVFEANRLVASLNDSTLEPLGVSGKVLVNNNGTWSWEDYGAGGGLDEDAMWAALGGTSDNKKIDNSHLSLKSLTFKAGASDTTGVAYSPTGDANETITFDAAANSGISVSRNSNTITIGYTMPDVTLAQIIDTDTTYTRFVVDAKGRVVKADKPTTLAGYGITDAVGSATKWWGQSIQTVNNEKVVKGNMTDVGTISASGDITITKTGNNIAVKLIGGSYGFGLHLGSGGTNRGLYDFTSGINKWLLYFNASNTILNYGNVGIGNDSPSYKLDVNGTANATEFRVGGNYITTHTTSKYLKAVTDKNELYIGRTNVSETSPTLHINNNSLGSGESAVADYQWHAGASTSWASHRVGRLYLYKAGDASSDRDVYFEIDKNGDVKLNGNFYATGAVSALGSNSSSGSIDASFTEFQLNGDTLYATIGGQRRSADLNLSNFASYTDLEDYVKGIKVNGTTFDSKDANGIVDLGTLSLGSYSFILHNVDYKFGSFTATQVGCYLLVNVYTGAGYNGQVSQDRVASIHFRTGNGSGSLWAGFVEFHRNGSFTDFYIVPLGNNTYELWASGWNYSGNSVFDIVKSSNVTWNGGNTTGTLPSSAQKLTAYTYAYTDSSLPANEVKIWGRTFDGENDISGAIENATTISASGNVTAAGFIRTGGTSSQFLKADGSVDNSWYLGWFGDFNNTEDIKGLRLIRIGGMLLPGFTSASWGTAIQWCSYDSAPSASNNNNWYCQLYGLTDDRLYFRTRTNGGAWTSLHKLLYSTDLDNYVTIDSAQTITGIKTFNSAIGVLGGLTPIAGGNVNTVSGAGRLWVKNALRPSGSESRDNTPNNGVVLEYGSGSWVGRLLMIDNGSEGVYWGGVANGTIQPWKKLAFQSELSKYLPLAGGVMTGAIQFNSKGTNSIYNGPNDVANTAGGALGNLVISSWYGVSFTTSCSGTPYIGTNAVSINCRTGDLHVGGAINTKGNIYCRKPNGGLAMYVGHLAGEAVRIEAFDSNGNWKAKGLTLLQNGNIGIGTDSPQYKLHVNGYTYTSRLYLADGVYLEKTTDGVHLVGAGFYSDSFVSALGSNPDTPGGGGGVIELTGILGSLHNSTTALSTGALYYNGSTWSFQTLNQGDNLSEPLKSINNVGSPGTGKKMLYSNGGSWGYMDVPDKYAKELNVGTGNDDKKIRLKLNDNTYSSYITVPYASMAGEASSATTATSAGKLSDDTSYTVWGRPFFENGKPKNASGRLSMGSSGDIYWEESEDAKFCISASFDGNTDSNMLLFQSATGGSSNLTPKIAITGYNGNVGIGTTDIGAKLHVAGTLKANGHVAINNAVSDDYWLYVDGNIYATSPSWFPSLELFGEGSGHIPYIDFHKGGSTTDDYTSRIAEYAVGTLTIAAKTGATGLVVGTNTNGDSIKIGGATLKWTANGLECDKDFYSTGAVSALGSGSSGGGGGISDISVAASLSGTLLTINVSGQTGSVDLSPISGTSGDYIPLSGSDAITGDLKPASNDAKDLGNSQGNRWRQIHGQEFVGETVSLLENKIELNFRATQHNNFGCKVGYRTYGDEALVFANKNASTSFIFYTGSELITDENNTYSGGSYGTPALQIKQNSVYINRPIINGVSPSYELYVNGRSYADEVWVGNYQDNRDVYFKRYNTQGGGILDIMAPQGARLNATTTVTSDMRLKNIVSFVDNLTVEGVAMAPIFNFKWKDRPKGFTSVGTSAQYWQSTLPNVVIDLDNILSLDYGATALASAVITARKVVDHELRIKQLEQENAILRKEIEELKAA